MALTCQACLDGWEFRCIGRGCAAWERRNGKPPLSKRTKKVRREAAVNGSGRIVRDREAVRLADVMDLPFPLAFAIRTELDAGAEIHDVLARFDGWEAPTADEVMKTFRRRLHQQDFWEKVREIMAHDHYAEPKQTERTVRGADDAQDASRHATVDPEAA